MNLYDAPLDRRRHTALKAMGCAVLGISGALTTFGCLLGLFLANLSFFGERPEVPVLHTILLLTGAAAGILVPVIVAALILHTWQQKLTMASVMLAVVFLGVLSIVSVLGF